MYFRKAITSETETNVQPPVFKGNEEVKILSGPDRHEMHFPLPLGQPAQPTSFRIASPYGTIPIELRLADDYFYSHIDGQTVLVSGRIVNANTAQNTTGTKTIQDVINAKAIQNRKDAWIAELQRHTVRLTYNIVRRIGTIYVGAIAA